MDFNVTEILTLLCKLADSECLKVTANEHSKFSVEEILRANHLSEHLKDKENTVIQGENDAIDCMKNLVMFLVNEEDNPSSTHDNYITSFQSVQGFSLASIFGLFTSFQTIFTRTWNYVFGNYQMSVNVRVAPVSSVLRVLPPTDQNTLTLRIRQIIQQNSITTYDALAAQIEQDSSLVRRIILRHLVEYVDEDLSMTVTRGI
ncbi:uncharacterized protein LOC129983570 isoform X1 [Argiope bruennichi]|uniref:uncharacterized protein LOC129983570 isoform X1 n=1 Tax=Argiope bruennichi TaxID=94029 RepID=UPI002494F643|nr:uncharacterized protein LOC129983570 isoform X1 [Argiope bruennichi]